MDWISYPQTKPNISQPYLVSISRPYSNASLTFNYIAYYDAVADRWHKHDSFEDDSIKEIINEKVLGWKSLSTYLG